MAASAGSPSYRTLARLQYWSVAGLALIAMLSLLAALQGLRTYLLLGALADGRPMQELWTARLLAPAVFREYGGSVDVLIPALWEPLAALEIAISVVAVGTSIGFYWLLFRAHRNLRALGVLPRYGAHWILTGWLVPFLNLVRPFQVIDDLWRGSGADPSRGIARGASSAWVPAWWALTLVLMFAGYRVGVVLGRGEVDWLGFVFAFELARIAAVTALIAIVRGIGRRQDALAAGRPVGMPVSTGMRPALAFVGVIAVSALTLGAGYGVGASRVEGTFVALTAQRAAREQVRDRQVPTDAGPGRDSPVIPPPPPAREIARDVSAADGAQDAATAPIQGGIEGGVEGGVVGGVVGASPNAPAPVLVLLQRVSGDPPEYPPQALQDGVQGTVILKVRIDASGAPIEVTPQAGNRLLTKAALKAVLGWRFVPVPEPGGTAEGTVSVAFRLPNSSSN